MDLIDQIEVLERTRYNDEGINRARIMASHDDDNNSDCEGDDYDEGSDEGSDESDQESQPLPETMLPNVNDLRNKLTAIKQRIDGEEPHQNNDTIEDTVIDSQPDLPKGYNQSHGLPQLNIDLSEITTTQVINQPTQLVPDLTQSTQVIDNPTQVINESTPVINDIIDDDHMTVEQRKRAIILQRLQERQRHKELEIEQQRQEETEREQRKQNQKQDLLADISNVTLTDEENDEFERPKINNKDLQQTQRFLDNQKKQQFFQPTIKKTNKFTASNFLNDFDDDDELNNNDGNNDNNNPKSETQDVMEQPLDMDKTSSPATSPIQNPIELYKSKLSTTIELDDFKSPELSKDTRLLIKKKYVKPRTIKNNGTKKLFKKLFNLNINQLSNHVIKQIEDLEDDEENEEIMGSLLEKEIERVQNIRRKEKLKEKQLQQGEQADEDENYESVPDSEFSGSDEEQDVDQSDANSDNDDADDDINDITTRKKARIIDSEEEEDSNNQDGTGDKEDVDGNEENDFDLTKSLLFSNLEPFNPSQNKSSKSIASTDPQLKQVINDTQIISSTQPVDQTQLIASTQKIDHIQTLNDTQIILNDTQVDINIQASTQKDNDEITPELVSQGRQLISDNKLKEKNDDYDDDDEDDDEDIQAKIKIYEEKIRRKELQMIKKRKEMERKGYKNIIEGEAEESEDEWAGIGGDDFEIEDVINSEDERMIDNNFNIDLKNDEIRKKFLEEYQIKDKKDLEKLLDDIKNHRLVKKATGLTIELSDEEDEILIAYRRQKMLEQQRKLAENAKIMKKLKSEKSKAFFESIDDDNCPIIIEDHSEGEIDNDDDNDEEAKENKKETIKEDFIRSKLSFLNNPQNQYEEEQHKLNNLIESDSDDNYQSLRMKSLTNLRKRPYEDLEIETDDDEQSTQKDTQPEPEMGFSDDELLPSRKPSIIKSFKSSSVNSFSGVTISKQYKMASGSKASITYMSKKKKVSVKGLNSNKF